MTKLNYSTPAALIAAFNAGAVFAIRGSHGPDHNGTVSRMSIDGAYVSAATKRMGDKGGLSFRPDGAWAYGPHSGGMRLVEISAAPAPSPQPLPFKSYQGVVDAFEAGAKFKVVEYATLHNEIESPVIEITLDYRGMRVCTANNQRGWSGYEPQGQNRIFPTDRLVMVSPAPAKTPGFPYASVEALVADFEAGAKFAVEGSRYSSNGPVGDMAGGAGTVEVTSGSGDGRNRFDLAGRFTGFSNPNLRLVKVADAPAPAAAWERPKPLFDFPKIEWPVAPETPEPEAFLKRFVTGEAAYCPLTGEVVTEFSFQKGELFVRLVDANGKARHSDSYRHDGTHKHDAKRDLVFGTPPQPVVQEKTYSVADLRGSAPAGVYRTPGGNHVVVLRHPEMEDRNTVLFVGPTPWTLGVVTVPFDPDCWSTEGFTLTDKKFTGAIA